MTNTVASNISVKKTKQSIVLIFLDKEEPFQARRSVNDDCGLLVGRVGSHPSFQHRRHSDIMAERSPTSSVTMDTAVLLLGLIFDYASLIVLNKLSL